MMHMTNTGNPIDFPKQETIWESTVDQGKFHCSVVRLGEYHGWLKVFDVDTNEVILERDVDLAYDAKFGPDIDDVQFWEAICIETIDS